MRRAALSRRDALDPAFREDACGRIAAHGAEIVSSWARDASARVLGGYLPIRSEVDPQLLMQRGRTLGLRVTVPAILGDHLEFRALDEGAALVPQRYGVEAPGEEAAVLRPDILLVPLAAFDRRGHRIGYGGGFYDRAIAALRADGRPLLTLGLAFSAQELERVPDEAFDMPLDALVTERGTVLRNEASRPPS